MFLLHFTSTGMLFPTFLEKNSGNKKKIKKNNSFSFNVFYARSIPNILILIFYPKGDGWWGCVKKKFVEK